MSDSPQGDGWWQASDGRWYPPSQASPTPGLAHSAFSPPSSSAARRTSGGGSTVNPKRRRAWLGPVIGVAAGLAVGIPLGAAISGGEPTSEGSVRSDTEIVSAEGATSVTQPPASRAPATTRASTTTAAPYVPTPEDFQVAIIETERSCFGSAGCNIRFRIDPTYVGTSALAPGSSYTVIYEVRGGDDVQTKNFTVEGGEARFREELISTPPNPTLTAVVVRVLVD